MDFSSNGENEIFFVDGAETSLNPFQAEALTSAAAHFLEVFDIRHEVDVYISKRSILHTLVSDAKAWHMPPSYDRDNSIVCVFVDPNSKTEDMIKSLAHEMIHAWQVERGDLLGNSWKGNDMSHLPYRFQPWEIEAHGNQEFISNLFFEDRTLTTVKKSEILNNTDKIFQEIMQQVKGAQTKESLKKVASVIGAVGLGAILGM